MPTIDAKLSLLFGNQHRLEMQRRLILSNYEEVWGDYCISGDAQYQGWDDAWEEGHGAMRGLMGCFDV